MERKRTSDGFILSPCTVEINSPYALRDKIIATCPRVLIQPDPRIAALVSILGARLLGIWRIERDEA